VGRQRPSSASARVLLVDPRAALRRSWARSLVAAGLDPHTLESLDALPALVHGRAPFVLFAPWAEVEPALARGGALTELLGRAQILALVEPADEMAATSARGRVFAVLERSDAPSPGLAVLVESAARAADAASVRAAGPPAIPDVVAACPTTAALMDRASGVASTPGPVLILGEAGAGKRLLASWLHAKSPRATRPLVVTALREPSSPAELELTLDEAREAAGGGTLVLDGVDALDSPRQGVLLEALRSRIGARVISTASPAVRDDERAGRFSTELFYALARHVLDVPPLRQRKGDIPVLVYQALRATLERLGLPPKRVSPDALRALRAEPWPGNVPELWARVERAAVSASHEVLTLGDFGLERKAAPPRRGGPPPAYAEARHSELVAFERAYVEDVLSHAGGNVTRASEIAGMDRANFRRLVKRARGRAEGREAKRQP
jgi:DNA-binding NtrC family response regulator